MHSNRQHLISAGADSLSPERRKEYMQNIENAHNDVIRLAQALQLAGGHGINGAVGPLYLRQAIYMQRNLDEFKALLNKATTNG